MNNLHFINSNLTINLRNSLPGMFFSYLNNEEKTILEVSKGCYELTEFAQEEIISNKHNSYKTLVYFEDSTWLLDKIQYNLSHRLPWNIEYRIICKYGRIKWVREIANGVYDAHGVVTQIEGYIEDITAIKETAPIVNTFLSYQKSINACSIVSITDKSGKIIFANDLFSHYSKYSIDELVGKDHRIVNSGYHSKELFIDLWTTIKSGKIWRGEIKNKAKDDSFYWVDTVISPILNDKNEIIQYLSIRNIITEKKEYERELAKALNDKYNELMQFNYIVSHNLRAPVANILGMAEIFKMPDTNIVDKESCLDFIHSATKKMDEVILDLNTILATRSAINEKKVMVEITEIIQSIIGTLQNQIEESQTVIKTQISDEALCLYTIKGYFESILYNLINNAIKYKSLERRPEITIVAQKQNDILMLSVEDNGIGIDTKRYEKKLFGLYQRFNVDVEGKGLGLYMTKTQVETLGGKISVNSELHKGTKFSISLPLI